VIVIANGDKLNWEAVSQMVGRSCRRFGLCEGKVYVMSGLPGDKGGRQYLDRLKESFAVDDGTYIAQALFDKFPSISNQDMRKEIANALGNPVKWRVLKDSF